MEDGHPDGHAVADLLEDHGAGAVGDLALDLDAPGSDVASVRALLGEPRPEDLRYPGIAILERRILLIADVERENLPEDVKAVARARGWRANVTVPMMREGLPIEIGRAHV